MLTTGAKNAGLILFFLRPPWGLRPPHSNMTQNFKNIFIAVEGLSGIGFLIAVSVGAWCYNIYEIFTKDFLWGELLARLLGIVVWPVGSFMGLFG